MAALRERPGVDARALEFLILTAARTNEVLTARWSDLDFDTSFWKAVPDPKGKRRYSAPLVWRPLDILKAC